MPLRLIAPASGLLSRLMAALRPQGASGQPLAVRAGSMRIRNDFTGEWDHRHRLTLVNTSSESLAIHSLSLYAGDGRELKLAACDAAQIPRSLRPGQRFACFTVEPTTRPQPLVGTLVCHTPRGRIELQLPGPSCQSASPAPSISR